MTSREVVLEGGSPWGFRMHGGVDQQQPLRVSRVNPGSKAALRGVREGDVISSINSKSTKDITNSEAHSLLKNAGSTLKLGLNEDLSGSPKRRQYRTVHQETQSETVKRSSITVVKNSTIETKDSEFKSDEASSIGTNEGTLCGSNGLISQRSTLSSTGSSAPSTPSDTKANNRDSNCQSAALSDTQPSATTSIIIDDVMADISNISRSRRRRNRRKSKRNSNCDTSSSSTSTSTCYTTTTIDDEINCHNSNEILLTDEHLSPDLDDAISDSQAIFANSSALLSKNNGKDDVNDTSHNCDPTSNQKTSTAKVEFVCFKISTENSVVVDNTDPEDCFQPSTSNGNPKLPLNPTATMAKMRAAADKLVQEELNYRVESPTPSTSNSNVKKTPPKNGSPVKSRSLDDDDVKITELSEASESEEKCDNNAAIVAEVESESDADILDDKKKLPTAEEVTDKMESAGSKCDETASKADQTISMSSSDDEEHIRAMLTCIKGDNNETRKPTTCTENPKAKKAKTRAELAQYFIPVYQNPRYLDAISEESSDLSDKEQKTERRKRSFKETKPCRPPFGKRYKKFEIIEQPKLLDTKIVDSSNITQQAKLLDTKVSHSICKVQMMETSSSGAEVVYIDEDSGPDETENEFADAEDDDFNECLKANGITSAKQGTYPEETEDTHQPKDSLPLTQLTPPLTPENKSFKFQHKIPESHDMKDFIKTIDTYIMHKDRKQLQTLMTDPRYLCLPSNMKNTINNIVQFDDADNHVEVAATYSNVITPTPSRSPSAGSDCSMTSCGTSKYNPNSSVGDVKSIDINSEIDAPPTLREICLNRLISLPFGADVLEELADVSRNLQELTLLNSNTAKTTNQLPAFMQKNDDPLPEINNNFFKIPVASTESLSSSSSNMDSNWVGLPTEDDPNVLVCVSPTQRVHLDQTKRESNEAQKLLDLHEKFINRRSYNDYEAFEQPTKSNRLLAIIKSSSIDKEWSPDNDNDDQPPPVPPRPIFARSLSATLPNMNRTPNFGNEARLKAHNLSEWLQFARDKSGSESELNCQCYKPEVNMRPATSMSTIREEWFKADMRPASSIPCIVEENTRSTLPSRTPQASEERRSSLPPNLFQKQLEEILRKEREVEEELKRLEAEKLRLETSSCAENVQEDKKPVYGKESETTHTTSSTTVKVKQIPIEIEQSRNDHDVEESGETKSSTLEKNIRRIPIDVDKSSANKQEKIIPISVEGVPNFTNLRKETFEERFKRFFDQKIQGSNVPRASPVLVENNNANSQAKTIRVESDNEEKSRKATNERIIPIQIDDKIESTSQKREAIKKREVIIPILLTNKESGIDKKDKDRSKPIKIEFNNNVKSEKISAPKNSQPLNEKIIRITMEGEKENQKQCKDSEPLYKRSQLFQESKLMSKESKIYQQKSFDSTSNTVDETKTVKESNLIKTSNGVEPSKLSSGTKPSVPAKPLHLLRKPSAIIMKEPQQHFNDATSITKTNNSVTTKESKEGSTTHKERTIPIRLESGKVFQPQDYFISKKGDIAIFNDEFENFKSRQQQFLSSLPPTEIFRQQMFEEYKNRMAERQERKQHKIIKISRPEDGNNNSTSSATKPADIRDVEDEFIDKAKKRLSKYGIKLEASPSKEGSAEKSDGDNKKDVLIVDGNDVLKTSRKLPKHLKEFVDITRNAENDSPENEQDGIWSPGQSSSSFISGSPLKSKESDGNGEPIPPVWTPKSAQSSPQFDRKEYKSVNFKSPTLGRKVRNQSEGSIDSIEPPWRSPSASGEAVATLSHTLEKRIPNSYSAPASGFSELSYSRLPKAQNPTITLLQKAREGQLPRGAHYIDKNENQFSKQRNDKSPTVNPGERIYEIRREYVSESDNTERTRKMGDLGPRKFDGIGPTTDDGMPVVLRSEVRDSNQSRWYKKMYDTIHRQKSDDEYVTVRYKQRRARFPYSSGYFSEPDPATYDSDASDFNKFATLDRRRLQSNNTGDKENEFSSSTMPRNTTTTVKYTVPSHIIRHGHDAYKNQPGRIENYVPGHSSISEKEAKEWWDEVMDIFDGHLEQQKHVPQTRSFINQALKESGYESDSTLIFRRRDDTAQQQLSPLEQKEAYKTIQKGGDVPLQGLRKPAPERPKENADAEIEYFPISPTLTRIRVHKSTANKRSSPAKGEVLCYPINIPPHPPHVFANYKKTAPSATKTFNPNPNPPSPPRRRSSRNNSTLRLISTMKIRPDKSPSNTKRHETCFLPSTSASGDVDKQRVKYLRDKITCKLSPKKRGMEDKARLKVTKTLTASPSLKSKISSTLTTSKDSGKITSKTKIDKSPDRCCMGRSGSVSPVRKMCKQYTLDVTRQSLKPTTSRGTSLERTFGSEKKTIDLTLPKPKRLVKSPDLLSPTEVKRAVLNQITSLPTYRKTTSVLSSVRNGTRSSHKEPSIPIKVGYTDKGKELLKLRPKSLPATPTLTRSNLRISSPSPSQSHKTRSNMSLNSISSRSSTLSKTKTTPSTVKTKSKVRKDLVNVEIAKKVKDRKSTTLPRKLTKTASTASNVSLYDIRKQKDVVQSNSFFQNLLLRDFPVSALSQSVPNNQQSSWIAERASMLNRRRSFSEPSDRALKIYLHHTKPVTDSKFRSLDAAALLRSRSASPRTIVWRSQSAKEVIRKKPVNKDRSASSPSKIVLTETSRPVSPVVEHRRTKVNVVKKSDRIKKSVSSPKLVFTETSRPISPVVQRKKRRETMSVRELKRTPSSKIILTETSRPVSPHSEVRSYQSPVRRSVSPPCRGRRSESPKFYSTETSRPISPVVQRRHLKEVLTKKAARRSESPKFYSTETSRPISPVSERRQLKEPTKKMSRRSESPKFYSTETSRPISPVSERRYVREALKEAPRRSESPKFYSTETSRPISPMAEGYYVREPKASKRSESPKFYSTETSRPISPVADRRYLKELRKEPRRSVSPKYYATMSPIAPRKAAKRSESPKLHFTETSRPISPLTERRLTRRDIINAELIRRRTPSPPKLFFTETSRPVSPLVERRFITREISPDHYGSVSRARSQSPKFVSTETSRPISPVTRRSPHRDCLKSPAPPPQPTKMIFSQTSRPMSPVVTHRRMAISLDESSQPQKLYFSETSRPVSPVLDNRKSRKSQLPVCKYQPHILQKSLKLRSRSAGDAEPSTTHDLGGPSSLTLSTSSIDSLDRKEYQTYIKELLQSTKKSSKFKDLNNFFATLERMGDLERTTSSAELRPRRKHEEEIIDFERWKEVRTRERAERELKEVYKTLKVNQREKGHLFLPKDVEAYKWKIQLDRGLRLKEKSVENIKEEFEKLKHEDSARDLTRRREMFYAKDTYKPLWRGNSVVNLAHNLTERRSLSEGRYKTTPRVAEKYLQHGIGSHIWSSLSMEQVNILKNQLNEIYSNTKKIDDDLPDHSIHVPSEKHIIKPQLTVRRNSDIPLPPPKPPLIMTSSLVEPRSKQMSEIDKRRLSQTLSNEVLERKKRNSPSLVFGKETRGAIAAAEAKVKYPETASPRTCYSLELSEDGQERELSKDNQFVLVLTDKNCDKRKVESTMQEFAQKPKTPLSKTDATATCMKSSNSEETESSTDGSTRTVVYCGNKADVLKKVEYFEHASERDVYTPTIHKPAEIAEAVENGVDYETPEESDESKGDARRIGKLSHSQSYQSIKELFGEQELAKLTTLPLSETSSKTFKTSNGPQLRSTSLSPVRSNISATSTDSLLCRSRSLSPQYQDEHLIIARNYGEVSRLKNRFENLDDYAKKRLFRTRRWRSDPQLDRKRIITIPGQKYGEVDNLRRQYEYPSIAGRGRSRYRRRGVVSPVYFRAEDRLMPHINIISKIASLYPRRSVSPPDETTKSNEELAEILGIPIGEVEKLRQKFDSPDRMSLLGHMFTSSPNIQELRDISPYLTASWTAHRYPRPEDNTRSLSSPEHSTYSRDTSLVRRAARPKSASPVQSPKIKSKPSILKTKEARKQDDYDPSVHRPVSRYQPEVPKQDSLRYRTWWWPSTAHNRPTVTFKEPEGPIPPPKGERDVRNPPIPETPRKYVENEVTIHYRTPVRQEIKEAISEDELAKRQAEAMKKIYQEERRRKYLQVSQSLDELQDMNSRRHADNFIPSQKSPISLNRYDDVVDDFSPKVKPRPRSPEPRLVARALYNFVGQSARELTFRKGDIIYIRRQVDKNWYEGELNAMIGLFPANYVEIIPYDGVKSTPRKSHEGQARAKYNFIAQTHLELSLAKGELVVVTRKVDNNWFEGRIGGRKGIFPVAYVEVLIDPSDPPPPSVKPVASPAAHSLLLNGSSGGKDSMGTHSYTPVFQNQQQQFTSSYHAKPVQLTGSGTYGTLTRRSPLDQTLHIDTQSEPVPYKALYKYRPQNDDELELMEGDTVFVLEKCDDGWFVGSSDRTGAFGTFPGNYVERI